MILLLLLLCFLRVVFSQDRSEEIKPEQFGYYFIHKPEVFEPQVYDILNSVVTEYNDFYNYSNVTVVCPTLPIVTCPPPTIMDTPCDFPSSHEQDSIGFFVTIFLITLFNLGLLCFTIWKGYAITLELFKTKINPFKVRSDPVTETMSR